jgi:aminopeptidase N
MVILSRSSLGLHRGARRDPADFSDVPDFFLAHELAHQWWGHGVAPASYHERWLSEALAQYAGALWVQHAQGEEAFRRVLDRMADWAIERSDLGPVSLGSRVGHVRGGAEAYRAIVYDKGALVAHMLRRLIGDAAFFAGLRELQQARRFQLTTTTDLRRVLERGSPAALEPFFQTWIRGTAIPVVAWNHSLEGDERSGYVTHVSIGPTGMDAPVWMEVSLSLSEKARRIRVSVPPEGGTFDLPTATRPRRVRINEDWALLAKLRRDKRLGR